MLIAVISIVMMIMSNEVVDDDGVDNAIDNETRRKRIMMVKLIDNSGNDDETCALNRI